MLKSRFCALWAVSAVSLLLVVYHGSRMRDQYRLDAYSKKHNTSRVRVMGPCVTGRPCMYSDDVDLRIIVITFNHADALQKLLSSLDNLVLFGHRGALEIWIDRDRNNGSVDQRTVNVASTFKWKRGTTRVHIQTHAAGNLGQWIDTWRPRNNSEAELGLILDDHIILSPYAYRWLRAVHRAYCHRHDFVGTSLTSDHMSTLFYRLPPDHMADTVVMYKRLFTGGFAPRPLHWRRFQLWFHRHRPWRTPHFHPHVPDVGPAIARRDSDHEDVGRVDSTWDNWFTYYMYMEQVYMVYSNLQCRRGNQTYLCTNQSHLGPLSTGLMHLWKEQYVAFPNNTVHLDWDGLPVGNRPYIKIEPSTVIE